MNLEGDKRLNIQLRLDFSSVPTGEARQAGREDIESLSTVQPLVAFEIHVLLTCLLVRAFGHRFRFGLSVGSTFRFRVPH